MMSKHTNIAFDLDGVLADFHGAFVPMLEIVTGRRHDREIHISNYELAYEASHADVIKAFDYVYNLYRFIRPIEGAKELVHTIWAKSKWRPITIVTSRPRMVAPETWALVEHLFPYVRFHIIHTAEKGLYLKEKGFKYFVEDQVTFARDLAQNGIKTFLLRKSYNISCPALKNIIPINSLTELQQPKWLCKFFEEDDGQTPTKQNSQP